MFGSLRHKLNLLRNKRSNSVNSSSPEQQSPDKSSDEKSRKARPLRQPLNRSEISTNPSTSRLLHQPSSREQRIEDPPFQPSYKPGEPLHPLFQVLDRYETRLYSPALGTSLSQDDMTTSPAAPEPLYDHLGQDETISVQPTPHLLYQPVENNEIRILTLLGTEPVQDPMQPATDLAILCKLETISLADARGSEECSYAALSYVWGSPLHTRLIRCNGHTVSVTANLYEALWYLIFDVNNNYGRGRPQKIWVDAICIDQGNNAEKSHQVAIMGHIYSKADLVIVWLGSCIDRAGREFEDYWRLIISHDEPRKPISEKVKSVGRNYIQNSNWFARSWTLQEIVLARKAEVRCGYRRVSWNQFVARNQLVLGATKELDSVAKAKSDTSSFPSLVEASAGRVASDPRDEIYSLLGMYTGHRDHGITPDYNLLNVVVRNMAGFALLQEYGSLDLFLRYECLVPGEESFQRKEDCSEGKMTLKIECLAVKDWKSHYHSWCPSYWYGFSRNSTSRSMCQLGRLVKASNFPARRRSRGEDLNFTRLNPKFIMDCRLDGRYLHVSGAIVGRCLVDRLAYPAGTRSNIQLQLASLPECVPSYIVGNLRKQTFSFVAQKDGDKASSAEIFQDPLSVLQCLQAHDRRLCNCSTSCNLFTRNSRPPAWPQSGKTDPWEDPSFQYLYSEEIIRDLKKEDQDRHYQLFCCAFFGATDLILVKPVFLDRECRDLVFEPYGILVPPREFLQAAKHPYSGIMDRDDTKHLRYTFSVYYYHLAMRTLSEIERHEKYQSQEGNPLSKSSSENTFEPSAKELVNEVPMANMSFLPMRFKLR